MVHATEKAGFAGLLQELKVAAGPGLDPVIRLAVAVQQRRVATGASITGEVTRTAAFIAIGELDSETRSRLEKAGLDWVKLHSHAQLSELPAPAETADDIAFHDVLNQALRRFVVTHPDRPVIGTVELALAIVDSVAEGAESGPLPERLLDSGLDVAAAKIHLEELPATPPAVVDLRGAASIGDEPATEDLLGRNDLVQALAAMLDHPSQGTPFTIGLLGDWGSGKTTVMQLLERELGGKPEGEPAKKPPKRRHDFTFAWFNAWQYEKTGNLAAGLAQETVKALVKGLGPLGKWWLQIRFAWSEYGGRFAGTLVGLLAQAVLAVAAAVLALAPDKVGLNVLDDVVVRLFSGTVALGTAAFSARLFMRARELWSHPLADRMASYLKLPDYEKHLGLIPVLHRHLKTLCELRGIRRVDRVEDTEDVKSSADVKGAKKDPTRRRLIVFVDDLDRCGSRAIVETFDAIRLVMVIPEVVLIIGIDARIAFRAVGSHYRTLADDVASPQDIARDFLGKIIQLPIRLGRPDNLKDFVQGLFASSRGHERSFTAQQAVAPPGPEAAAAGSPPPALGTEVQPDVRKGRDPRPPKTEVEEKAARAAIRVELDRDMEHSPEESRQFETLAETFDIYNPRKLLRLRNSYRLLKLFDLQLARRSPEHERFDPSLLMASLFWQEFLFACTPALRKACEEAVGSPDKATNIPDAAVRKIVESFLAKLKENLDWSGGLDRARNFVRRLVLPRGDTWTTRAPGANTRKR